MAVLKTKQHDGSWVAPKNKRMGNIWLNSLVILPRGAAGIGRFALFAYLFLATASHGVLDAMTNGGLGVAFFSPFDTTRYFLPWRPIRVSPSRFGSSLASSAILLREP